MEIYAFQHQISEQLETKIADLEKEAEDLSKEVSIDPRIKNRFEKDLDAIVEELKELETYSRINFSGFMKVSFQLTLIADF
jgi:SPX domain protein involved in polyphosphate accumulation